MLVLTLGLVLALGLMPLAGCHFSADPTNTAVASSESGGSGGTSNATGGSAATLHWEMPTENTNGTPLTDLAGYTIVYGRSPQTMNQWVQVLDIGTTSYVVNGLTSGTWYFAILSYTTAGANSALSNVVSSTIP